LGDTLIYKPPFFQAPNDVFLYPLDTKEKLTLLYLMRCGNNSTAFPSYKDIGKKTSTSRSTAIRAVSSLVDKGFLIKTARMKKNKDHHSNIYEIVFPSVSVTPPSSRQAPGSEEELIINDHNNDNAYRKYLEEIKNGRS